MKKKVLLKAPILTRSGYGEQSRFAYRALKSREDMFDIYIHPLTWGETSWLQEDTEERNEIDRLIEKTIHYIQSQGQFDLSLQVTIPNEWERHAPINIGYTAGIETHKTSASWLQKGNEMDKIIVVSEHSKNVYKGTEYEFKPESEQQDSAPNVLRLETEIDYVNYPTKVFKNIPDIELNLDYDFNFFCMAQLGPRKNIMNTMKWFVEEFHDEEVGLVLKTNFAKNSIIDREHVFGQLLGPVNKEYPDRKCKIYLLHGDMTDEEVHAIYNHPKIKAALSLTHGEGFGLPLFEAAYSGLPVVAPGWSGQMDFLCDEKGKEHFYNVGFDIRAVPEEILWEEVIIPGSMWCYPRETSAKSSMRLCYKDIIDNKGLAKSAKKYAKSLNKRFEESKMYGEFVESMGIDMEEFDVQSWLEGLDAQEIG